jgi:hypothetical protein
MTFSRPPSRINLKVSTMPRQQSEAAQYLNAYKLSIEKKRLQLELDSLGQRRDRIQERLDGIERQLQTLEDAAQQYREPVGLSPLSSAPNSVIYPPSRYQQDTEAFKTVTLDY